MSCDNVSRHALRPTQTRRRQRSLSWIVQQAWRIARGEIMRFPSVNDVLSGVAREDEREEKGG